MRAAPPSVHDPFAPRHPFAQLAFDVITAYVVDFRFLRPSETLLEQFPELRLTAGVFVSLKKDGVLRGCIGTTGPTRENLAVEIAENAISAASKDSRFRPVEEEELAALTVSVDILSAPERVEGTGDLDARLYGVIVQSGGKRGLLLPDIQGIASVDAQLSIARQKGGIGESDVVELYRFQVERYF